MTTDHRAEAEERLAQAWGAANTAAEVIHLRYAQVHATLAGPADIDQSWRDLLAAARNVLEHADAGVFTGSAAVPWQYLSALSECAGRAMEAGQ